MPNPSSSFDFLTKSHLTKLIVFFSKYCRVKQFLCEIGQNTLKLTRTLIDLKKKTVIVLYHMVSDLSICRLILIHLS